MPSNGDVQLAGSLLDAAGVMPDAGVVDASDTKAFVKAAMTRQWERESKVRANT